MQGSLRERIATLSRGELVGLVIVIAVTLAGAAVWYVRSLPEPVAISTTADAVVAAGAATPVALSGGSQAAGGSSTSPTGPTLIVHVAGWVQHPGVFEFEAGSRAIDAVEHAGGPRKGANLAALNLAAPLVDGQQLVVPGPERARSTDDEALDGTSDKININTADAGELEELPGVGEVLAQSIIDFRDEHGPFAKPEDLLDVSGIGDATLAEMQDQVTV